MKGNESGNDSNYWDQFQSRVYDHFFSDADRITESYRRYGKYSLYESFEDNDDNIVVYHQSSQSSNIVPRSYTHGESSGASSYNKHLPDDEALARQIQEMEGGIGGMSIDGGLPERAIGWHGCSDSHLADDEAINRELHGSDYISHLADDAAIARELHESDYASHLADDAAIARELHESDYSSHLAVDAAIARELHGSDYNCHLADDAAIARQLQEMEDSLGVMSLYDRPFGSLTGSADDHRGTSARSGVRTQPRTSVQVSGVGTPPRTSTQLSGVGSRTGTSTQVSGVGTRPGTSTLVSGVGTQPGTSTQVSGVVTRPGTSTRVSGVQTQAGHQVDIDNMTYEEISQLEQSIGNVGRGLSQQVISRLPIHKYSPSNNRSRSENNGECVICKMDYERGDKLITLPCTHHYHEDCIKKWFKDKKTCCICKQEVTV